MVRVTNWFVLLFHLASRLPSELTEDFLNVYELPSSVDQSGWSWYIPLHNGTVSVGFVMSEESSIAKKKALRASNPESDKLLRDHFVEQLQHAPGLQKLLKHAKLVDVEAEDGGVKSASDYSYSAKVYGGDHFRLVGDAGGV